jgi:hypothetical protein
MVTLPIRIMSAAAIGRSVRTSRHEKLGVVRRWTGRPVQAWPVGTSCGCRRPGAAERLYIARGYATV